MTGIDDATMEEPAAGRELTPELLEEIRSLLRQSGIRHGQAFRGIEQGKTPKEMAAEWGDKSVPHARKVIRSVELILAGELPTSSSMAYENSFGYRELWELGASPALLSYIKVCLGKLQVLNSDVIISPMGKVSFPVKTPLRHEAAAPGGAIRLDVEIALNSLYDIKVETGGDGKKVPYQYLVLLWALSAARRGVVQPIRFRDAKVEIAPILDRFAVANSRPDPANPWFALRQSSWWFIPLPVGRYKEVSSADMAAGLSREILRLMDSESTFVGRAVSEIRIILMGLVENPALIDDVLDELHLRNLKRFNLIPVESNVVERFTVNSTEHTDEERERAEARLQNDFRAHLEAQGHQLYAIDIPLDGEHLKVDLYDATDDTLIEVKACADRNTIRAGLGQILDYARVIKPRKLCLLLPQPPVRSLIYLLRDHGVQVVYRSSEGFREHVE